MKKVAVIFGGSGYIGRNMISEFLMCDLFELFIVCDIKDLVGFEDNVQVLFKKVDVRNPILMDLGPIDLKSSWIFNFAAVHREPGHTFNEYFDTNIPGAKNVTEFAARMGIANIFFTSSIAPYGKSLTKRTEESQLYPETAYGISKALAEKIHETWLFAEKNRRLVIVRPSVIFGPHDPGNVYRMIKALKKGSFILPNGGNVIKAYGYIYGLIESMVFTMAKSDRFIVYNYAENPLVPLKKMTEIVKNNFGYKKPVLSISVKILSAVAVFLRSIYRVFGKSTDIHPVRVKKAGFPTNIEPKYLIDNGFKFNFQFENALEDWRKRSPNEF